MKFTIENPNPRLSWKTNDGAACRVLFDDKPVFAMWHSPIYEDDDFFVTFPDSNNYRKGIESAIKLDIYLDYSGSLDQLHAELTPLLAYFENGEYTLHVSNSHEQIAWPTWSWQQSNTSSLLYKDYSIFFPTPPPKSNYSHHLWFGDIYELNEKVSDTTCRHNALPNTLLSTIPYANIDLSRVSFYEEQINNGKRPAAIVFRSLDFASNFFNFILDGHCRLLAYANVGCAPNIIFISLEMPDQGYDYIPWKTDKFLYSLAPWQARSMLYQVGTSNELKPSKGNIEFLGDLYSGLAESYEVYFINGRIVRRKSVFV